MTKSKRMLRYALLLAALPLLANCDNHDRCDFCYSAPPTEVSAGLVAGNFSNNGQNSLVTLSTVLYSQVNAGNLKTYLSSGPGAFAAPTLTSDGYDPLYIAAADFNGDGLPDVVSASYNDGALRVFLNTAQTPGTFSAPILLTSPGASQVAIGDVNGDGLPDIVSADFNVSLFVQTAPGQFAAPVSLYPGGANWVSIGDLNGDGFPDIALTDAAGVKVLFNTGAAGGTTFGTPVTIMNQTPNAGVTGANIIGIADVNGDGLDDLVIYDPGPTGGSAPFISVLLQDAAHPGQFLAAVNYPVAPHNLAQSIVITDLDGDGKLDIVIGGTNSVSVLLQDPANTGAFLVAANYPAPYAAEIAVADVNGDGFPDIVVTTGPSSGTVNGIITNAPGVLLQSATARGTFGSLQALP
jgi:FG-GAP-like repeat